MTGRFTVAEPVVDGMKCCTKCGQTKPVEDFPIRIDRGNKPRSHCRLCHNAAAKTPRSKALQKAWRYQAKYGMTVEQIAQLLVDQDSRCAICGVELTEQNMHVDHDHDSGIVRGVLCDLCNKGLGQFKDNADILLAAAAYLVTFIK